MLARPSKRVQHNRNMPIMPDVREFGETSPFVSNQEDTFCNLLNASLRTGGDSVDSHSSSEAAFVTPTNQSANFISSLPDNLQQKKRSHRRSRSSISSNALDKFLGMPGLTDERPDPDKSSHNIAQGENEDTLDGFVLEL